MPFTLPELPAMWARLVIDGGENRGNEDVLLPQELDVTTLANLALEQKRGMGRNPFHKSYASFGRLRSPSTASLVVAMPTDVPSPCGSAHTPLPQ